MTIKQAIEQIDNRTQEVPSNWDAGKGLSDGVTWAEVREWLASLAVAGDATLARVWQSAYWQGCADERSATEANIGYGPNRVNPYGKPSDELDERIEVLEHELCLERAALRRITRPTP